jgi:hypothetical protein
MALQGDVPAERSDVVKVHVQAQRVATEGRLAETEAALPPSLNPPALPFHLSLSSHSPLSHYQ